MTHIRHIEKYVVSNYAAKRKKPQGNDLETFACDGSSHILMKLLVTECFSSSDKVRNKSVFVVKPGSGLNNLEVTI